MVIRDLKSLSPIVAMSIPSIRIAPRTDSMIRNSANVSEDLPAPVLPTIPTYKGGDKDTTKWTIQYTIPSDHQVHQL